MGARAGFFTCVWVMIGVAATAVAQAGDFQAAIDWIYYQDGSSRTINYDFSGATMDGAGIVDIPSSAVTVPAPEAGVTFSWMPGDGSQDVSYTGGTYYISVPQALASPATIPTANITVDGSAADWAGVSTYIADRAGDVLDGGAPAGADVLSVKLAYSPDYSKLYILYQLNANASTSVWYRLFLDNDADDETDEPNNYQIDAEYGGSSWDVVSQSWDDDGNWFDVAEGGVIAVSGSVVELSVDCSTVGLPAKTVARGRTMQTSSPYATYDAFATDFMRTEGFAFLMADGAAAPVATDWTAAARFSNFTNPGFGASSPYLHYYGPGIASGSNDESDLQAGIVADWATGEYGGAQFENALVIQAYVEKYAEGDEYEWWWDPDNSGGLVLEGLDPNTAVIDLKIVVTNTGQKASFYYRVNSAASDYSGSDWQLAVSHTLPAGTGTMYGFPTTTPGAGLETGINRSAPMYRFWSPQYGKHFYTMNKAERDFIRATYALSVWTYEGVVYHVLADDDTQNLAPVYRFWSPQYGGHFYTISEAERDSIIATYPSSTWTYEGPVFYAYPAGSQPEGTSPVYRFWSPLYGGHFYTISEAEKDSVIATYPSSTWTYEGIAWYAYQ